MGLALNLVSVLSVERRRRDKINNWIVTLSKIIPDCSVDSRTGAVSDSRVCKKTKQTTHHSSVTAGVVLLITPPVCGPPEQRKHPVQGLRLHPGAASEQSAAAGELQGGGAGQDGQRAATTAG